MATKKKITRKKLKEPDEFVSTTTELYQWILQNWKYFLAGMIVLILIAGGVFLWRTQTIKKEKNAFALYRAIQVKLVKTEAKGAKICDDWKALIKNYRGTPAAVYAQLQESSCFLQHKAYDKSEAALQKLTKDPNTPAVVKVLSLLLKGYALEEKKAYKEAEEVFGNLLKDPANFLKDTTRYHLYICQLKLGKKETAKKTLSGLKITAGSDFALPVMLVKIEKAQLGIKE
jgi:predicted negative regulator of RcsB-dependent stress response